MGGGAPPSGRGKVREGSLANEGTSLRGMDNNFCFMGVCVCVLQVTLVCESIVLYMCEGKVLMDIENHSSRIQARRAESHDDVDDPDDFGGSE